MKRISRFLTALFLCLTLLTAIPLSALAEESSLPPASSEPVSSAASESEVSEEIDELPELKSGGLAVVRSIQTGQVLFDSAGKIGVDPATSTKLMTAMVVYDLLPSLDAEITVNAAALVGIGDYGAINTPMIGLEPGEKYTARQLMQAALISAANDACSVLAYAATNGDLTLFVQKMNEKASSIGCTDTLYTNCVGMVDDESRTTVSDVSLVAAAFYRYNTLLEISSMPTYTIGGSTIHTKNYLLSGQLYSGAVLNGARGMIAGQKSATGGYCLISSGENEGHAYVYVIMDAPGEQREADGTRSFPANNAYTDLKKLFTWVPSYFGYVELLKEGELLGELPVANAADNLDHISYAAAATVEKMIPKTHLESGLHTEITLLYEELDAPVAKGTVVGSVAVTFDGELLETVNLITANEVERSALLSALSTFKSILSGKTVRIIINIILGCVALYLVFTLVMFIYRNARKAGDRAEKRRRERERNGKHR